MRIKRMVILIAVPLALTGCAGGLGGLLGSVLGGGDPYGNSGYGNDDFERAAVNACGREASRYGRVSITDVDRDDNEVRVRGVIRTDRDGDRRFGCTFRSDGRITDFDID